MEFMGLQKVKGDGLASRDEHETGERGTSFRLAFRLKKALKGSNENSAHSRLSSRTPPA